MPLYIIGIQIFWEVQEMAPPKPEWYWRGSTSLQPKKLKHLLGMYSSSSFTCHKTTDYASTLNNSVASAPGSPTGTSKLSGCTYKGKQLYGNVYISPSYFGADFTVYPTSSSFGADLKVFKTNSYFLATSCGIWNIVNSPISANFSVYLAPSSFSADFNVYFTSSSYSAGLTN
jgi:Family of unknown function (DUF6150)